MTTISRVLPDRPHERLADFLDAGGGAGLDAARRVEPEAVIAELKASGLRGRGGAGFPTGVKWETVAAHRSWALPTTVVANGAEGEPGTYKDRALLRASPYAVVEGAAIAALAVGADRAVVALKASGTTEWRRVEAAVAEMAAAGMLDGVAVELAAGPDEYLFGEETALLEVLDGRPPLPRIAPPYRRGFDEVVEGADDVDSGSGLAAPVHMAGPGGATAAPPALVDNVETLANVGPIVARGAEWFRSAGTDRSPGTILCTVTGDARRPGVGEVVLGTTVREAIDAVGHGLAPRRRLKAVLNGVSAPPLDEAGLDVPLTYEDMAAAGSALGTASLMVVGHRTDMTAVAAGVARFLAVESCGQCVPCKSDGLRLAETLERLCRGGGVADDLDTLAAALATVGDGARCNLALQQQQVVGRIMARWGDEFAARLAPGATPVEPMLVSEVLGIDDEEGVILDVRRRAKQPDWSYDDTWSGLSPTARFADHRRPGAS